MKFAQILHPKCSCACVCLCRTHFVGVMALDIDQVLILNVYSLSSQLLNGCIGWNEKSTVKVPKVVKAHSGK